MGWKHTVESLTPIVQASTSYWQVADALGLQPNGASSHRIKGVIKSLGICTKHFKRFALGGRGRKVPLAERLVLDRLAGRRENSERLYQAILEAGIPERCSCGLGCEWQGKRLRLHLDHINGNPLDNRLENLRFLCPNCHSQTDTYCGRNRRGKWKVSSSPSEGELRPGV